MNTQLDTPIRPFDRHRSRVWLFAAFLVVLAAGCTSSGAAGTEPDDPISVAEALQIDDDELHDVSGFAVFVDQRPPRLCAALAESYPAQCGQPSIALAGEPTSNPEALFGDELTTNNGVSWTPNPVTVTGSVATSGAEPELWITD